MNGKEWIQLALEALGLLITWGMEKLVSNDNDNDKNK